MAATTLPTPAVFALLLCLGPAAGAAQPSFDYFRNSWGLVGLKDYPEGTRITPHHQLLLAGGQRVGLRFGQRAIPTGLGHPKHLVDGWLPVVVVEATDGPLQYEFTYWASPLRGTKNWLAAMDRPVESEGYTNWILVRATNQGQQKAEAMVSVGLESEPAAPAQALSWLVAPGQSAERTFAVRYQSPTEIVTASAEEAHLWLDRTCSYWRNAIGKAAHIEVPCQKANQALLAAHVCQLISSDRGELHGGEGFYDQLYIRDGGYQIMHLEEAGLWEDAATTADLYFKHQRSDGRFETQTGQLDANGQALWTLWQHYLMTRDAEWLARAYPSMKRAADWVGSARLPASDGSPLAGLLPAAPADGENLWDGTHHIVGYDFWNLRGLLVTAQAARVLGRTADGRAYEAQAADYRRAIDRAWQRTGGADFPPSWENEGTHWGNTETLWPTPIFPADDPRVAATVDHARRVHGGGFAEGTIRWLGFPSLQPVAGQTPAAIHPYLSAYTTLTSLALGQSEQVADDLAWYLVHSSSIHAFPEGVYYEQRNAWNDTIPHCLGAANYALLLRHMLVHESGDQLHLLAGVPDEWLAEGRQIDIERAPTHFGTLTLRTRGRRDGVELDLEIPGRNPPRAVVVHCAENRPLIDPPDVVRVALRAARKKPWNLEAVVASYERQAPPLSQPIPGLIRFPLTLPPSAAHCVTLDLTQAATTHTVLAPVGGAVKPDARSVYQNAPLGRVEIARVPFHIIDPAGNAGRGLVVLHSPKAPQGSAWPHQVAIPVAKAGRRLFFLGNVHAYSGGDPGNAHLGAVGEYAIEYADGQSQSVPLITGRTVDNWLGTPLAEEAYVGVRRDPWHWNVLAVELRPVTVRRIVFRDFDTPAAPMLVAVTLETP